MKRIDFASPVPIEPELPYCEFQYRIKEKIFLPEPEILVSTTFLDVLTSRYSRRSFKAAVSTERLNALLWHSARAITIAPPNYYSRWQHRPSPSAGGRHPIDLIIFGEQRNSQNVFLYDPVTHGIYRLAITDELSLKQLTEMTNQIVLLEKATIILFGAQFDRTLSKYKDGESLVWRDAGALIATISLVAESLELNCCALGITGEPFLSKTLDSRGQVVGVGGLLVGERV
jgi:SagB-type dehydrogenase family enzyme